MHRSPRSRLAVAEKKFFAVMAGGTDKSEKLVAASGFAMCSVARCASKF